MRYLRSMALTSLCFYALLTSAHADIRVTTDLEQQLYQLSLNSHVLLIKYYHAQAEEGKQELLHDVRQRQQALAEAWQALMPVIQVTHPQALKELEDYWRQLNQYLNHNLDEVESSNFPELQVVTLMRDQLYLFMRQLDQIGRHWQQNNGFQHSAQQQLLRDQQRLLLTVVERYIERAASSMGAPLTIDGEDLHALIQRFNNGLSLIERWPLSQEQQPQVHRIRSQWNLIARTAISTDQRLVPYLIMRYTDNLLERIPQLNS